MMQILPTGACSTRVASFARQIKRREKRGVRGRGRHDVKTDIARCQRGFTLVEMIAVVFIISLATALIMPSLWREEQNTLKTEARHISSTLRYVYGEATGKKQIYLFRIDLDGRSWGFEGGTVSRNFTSRRDVTIRDVLIPSHGMITGGEITIEFGPMGPEEPVIVHLGKGESDYTVMFNHLTGRTKTLEGYIL